MKARDSLNKLRDMSEDELLNRQAELREQLVKVRARHVEAQIATIKFLPHRKISCAWKNRQPTLVLSGLKRKRPEWRPTRRDG